MNKMHKLLLLTCLLCTLMLAMVVSASAAVYEGDCSAPGSSVSWSLDTVSGELTISGTGAMADYSGSGPWGNYYNYIKKVIVEEGVTGLGVRAFYFSSYLNDVSLPASVSTIGNNAFADCSKLTSITVDPNNRFYCSDDGVLFSYGKKTLLYYPRGKKLASYTVPDGVTRIEGNTFTYDTNLTSLTLPASVESIGERAFNGCTKLAAISIAGCLTDYSKGAFSNTAFYNDQSNWSSGLLYCGNHLLAASSSLSGTVTVKTGTVSIAGSAFSSCTAITGITLPGQLLSIGEQCFYQCSGLTSLTIPNSVKKIGSGAFIGCSSLQTLRLGSGLTELAGDAFDLTGIGYCDALAMIRVEAGNPCFCDVDGVLFNADKTVLIKYPACRTQTAYAIPDTVRYLPIYAFHSCKFLESVSIPAGVSTIENYAFLSCSALTSVTFSEGLRTIKDSAFAACPCLESVDLPDSLQHIGRTAFSNCSGLKSVTIGDGVKIIEAYAFEGCTALTYLYFGSGVSFVNDYAFYKVKLQKLDIADLAAWCQIKWDYNEANPIRQAQELQINGVKTDTLVIPEGVESISGLAFISATCVKAVTLPKSLLYVGEYAFSGCTSIGEVIYAGSETDWGKVLIERYNAPLLNAPRSYNTAADEKFCCIDVEVSDGGKLLIDKNYCQKGETVTITAVPYVGYELVAVYLDGAVYTKSSFSATGSHTLSASFRLSATGGGTPDYRLNAISVSDTAGEKLQEMRAGSLLASVSVTNVAGEGSVRVMFVGYDSAGRYHGLMWLTFDELPVGASAKATLPLDNAAGDIAYLKAFIVGSPSSFVPVGNAVYFGKTLYTE